MRSWLDRLFVWLGRMAPATPLSIVMCAIGDGLLSHRETLQADHPIGHWAEPLELHRHAHNIARVIKIDQRQIATQLGPKLLIDGVPFRLVGGATTFVKQP